MCGKKQRGLQIIRKATLLVTEEGIVTKLARDLMETLSLTIKAYNSCCMWNERSVYGNTNSFSDKTIFFHKD